MTKRSFLPIQLRTPRCRKVSAYLLSNSPLLKPNVRSPSSNLCLTLSLSLSLVPFSDDTPLVAAFAEMAGVSRSRASSRHDAATFYLFSLVFGLVLFVCCARAEPNFTCPDYVATHGTSLELLLVTNLHRTLLSNRVSFPHSTSDMAALSGFLLA